MLHCAEVEWRECLNVNVTKRACGQKIRQFIALDSVYVSLRSESILGLTGGSPWRHTARSPEMLEADHGFTQHAQATWYHYQPPGVDIIWIWGIESLGVVCCNLREGSTSHQQSITRRVWKAVWIYVQRETGRWISSTTRMTPGSTSADISPEAVLYWIIARKGKWKAKS